MKNGFIHYCDKFEKCDWKCFHFDTDGIKLGKIPNYFEHDPYFKAHKEHCGGEIKQVSIKEPLPWEELFEAVRDWVKKWDDHTGNADLSPEGKKVKEILSRFPERGGEK